MPRLRSFSLHPSPMVLKRLRCFDCASLRPATRKFSASSYTSYSPSSSTPAFPYSAPVPHRAVIRVAGKDATKFLNGLAAVKIPETIEGSRSFYGSFLHAQGRILHDTFIHPCPTSNAFLIEYDARSPTSLLESIKKFVLRSKVGLKDVSSEWDVWAAWGHQDALERAKGGQRAWRWGNGASAALNWETEPERLSDPSENETGGWDLRAPGMGWRGLVRKGKTPSLAETGSSCQATDAYTLHRIMRGVPEGVDDLVPMSSLPSESCLDFMGGVDFRKGCYVGQELTVRTYHTGVIRKRIMPVQLFSLEKSPPSDLTPLPGSFPHPLPTALDIRLNSLPTSDTPDAKTSRGRSSGRLLSNVQGVALALLRLEQVQTVWRGEGSMSVVDSEGNTFGVKPFKVDWWPVENPEEEQEVKRSV